MKRLIAVVAVAALAGCASNPLQQPVPESPGALRVASTIPKGVQHVIIVVQEGRSFNDLFEGFPGADTSSTGATREGQTVPLRAVGLPAESGVPVNHSSFVTEYADGKGDGWPESALTYVRPDQVRPYWKLAREYALADHMFPTETGDEMVAHQTLIRGSTQINPTEAIIGNPIARACDSPAGATTQVLHSGGGVSYRGPFPCFTWSTIATLLDAAHVSWKQYTPVPNAFDRAWNPFAFISGDWSGHVVVPQTQIFSDIKHKTLPAVSYVVPDYASSDVGGRFDDDGPSWVLSIVNAVQASRYWNDAVVFVVWDDWGGYYDGVIPPQLDFAGLNFRVPLIVVSPLVKRGYISHTPYEFGSILKFIEDDWNLGRLNTTDVRANSLDDLFQP